MNRVFYKDKGVASVIGTLFALLLIVTLISAFMTQYVPVYMKTNEAQHDSQIIYSLSQMKTFIDLLVATDQVNYSLSVNVPMGATGIPIFAPSTPSQITVSIASNVTNITIFNKGKYILEDNSTGYVQIYALNSYYPQEKIIYVNGAIVRNNVNYNTSTIFVGPGFSIQNTSKGYILNYYIYNIVGMPGSNTGTNTESLGISLLGITRNTYTNTSSFKYVNITINKTYNYADNLAAWYYSQSLLYGYNGEYLLVNNNEITFENVTVVNVITSYLMINMESS
ncbi:MAG: hypothetical protein ACP5RZ_02895 [Thermoplasmata archaeon]